MWNNICHSHWELFHPGLHKLSCHLLKWCFRFQYTMPFPYVHKEFCYNEKSLWGFYQKIQRIKRKLKTETSYDHESFYNGSREICKRSCHWRHRTSSQRHWRRIEWGFWCYYFDDCKLFCHCNQLKINWTMDQLKYRIFDWGEKNL